MLQVYLASIHVACSVRTDFPPRRLYIFCLRHQCQKMGKHMRLDKNGILDGGLNVGHGVSEFSLRLKGTRVIAQISIK